MYRWEIMWKEYSAQAGFELTHFKGFKTREQYEGFKRRLEKKGVRIIGRIEDGRQVA